VQQNNPVNVWGAPSAVTKVNSLQDLAKLPIRTEVQPKLELGEVTVTTTETKEKHQPRGGYHEYNPTLREAVTYCAAHPEELVKDVAKKFGVSLHSLYTLRYKQRVAAGTVGTPKAKAKEKQNTPKKTREEILKMAWAARSAKCAAAREAKAQAKAAQKAEWKQGAIVTSNKAYPLGRDAEGYQLIELNGRVARMLSNRVVPEADNVNHPAHYKTGGIETIDFIEAKQLTYNLGNVVKYVSRADHKGNRLEDLEKAAWYLAREIQNLKK
jgi:transposase-like protein